MATYILVHGGDVSTETWNRLTKGAPIHTANDRLGGRVWENVTPALKAKGHRTFTPTLIDEHNCNLHGHIEQINLLIAENNLKDIILVGHSYGGMIITGQPLSGFLPQLGTLSVQLGYEYGIAVTPFPYGCPDYANRFCCSGIALALQKMLDSIQLLLGERSNLLVFI